MKVVSSREFVANQEKYFDLALNERIFVKKGIHTFYLANANEDDAELLTLAKERRNNSDRELVSVDELINYLRK